MNRGDSAKLISCNDAENYTFLGRFASKSEASSIGYEVSQKAHMALKWLIQRQGYRSGQHAVVAWAISGAPTPIPVVNPFDVSDDDLLNNQPENTSDVNNSDFDHDVVYTHRDMGQSFSLRLKKVIQGYRANLNDTNEVIVMALDCPTKGRLSITYYRELFANDYLEKLSKWQEDCAWPRKMKIGHMACAPTPREIAMVAYGRRCDKDKNKTLIKSTMDRMLPCIVDGAPIPRDLIEGCVRKVCNKVAYDIDKFWEYTHDLSITCGLYRGWRKRTNKEYLGMSLDENIKSRDYLYGRLLAVAEYIERTALNYSNCKRWTNAERLMPRFVDCPCSTWLQIEKQIRPYRQKLQSSQDARMIAYYVKAQKALSNIMEKFSENDFTSNAKLGGEFLLGYYCQNAAMYTKTVDKEAEKTENNPESMED